MGSFWRFVCRQPPPANPFSKPPTHATKYSGAQWHYFCSFSPCRGVARNTPQALGGTVATFHVANGSQDWACQKIQRTGALTIWACNISETGRLRFRRVRFQTPNSVSFLGLTEFRGANSASSSQPIICVLIRTHRVFRRAHRVCLKTH